MTNYSEARQFAEEIEGGVVEWWSWKNLYNILLGTAISFPLTTAIPIISFLVIVLTEAVSRDESWSIIALTVSVLIMMVLEKMVVLIGLWVFCIRECIIMSE